MLVELLKKKEPMRKFGEKKHASVRRHFLVFFVKTNFPYDFTGKRLLFIQLTFPSLLLRLPTRP